MKRSYMVRNSLGRLLPESFNGCKLLPYQDPYSQLPSSHRASRTLSRMNPGQAKLLGSLRAAIEAAELKDGMCISTHHHLRNGDTLLVAVVREIAALGLCDIKIASSSIHPVHAELIPYIEKGVISSFECGVNGTIGELVSKGELKCPVIVRTHGGRARSVISGQVRIDAAFIAAPTCDNYGNLNGVSGPSACGSLGYAHTDALYVNKVIAVTDNLVPYPATPISIPQTMVDFVVQVESLGDPQKIISTTTRITRDPVGLQIAKYAAQVIEASGLLRDGFSFQTGSGGISLAVADQVRAKMQQQRIKGSFGCGGITGYFVDMLEEGLFQTLFDVQCFDLRAVESIGKNNAHVEISADMYANPFNAGAVVNQLDCVILGATEVDVNFNGNVVTHSDGLLMHGIGGWQNCLFSKTVILPLPLFRNRIPVIVDEVTTLVGPGELIDIIVTERGIAINPLRKDLIEASKNSGLPIKTIRELKDEAERICGKPHKPEFTDEIIAAIKWVDGTVIDVVRKLKKFD
ncbi:MAG: citrate lyase subunit alpha [Bacteroidales bacterium]|nr:citrate lyase subunit alpha [Bacteroidales bacterium]